MASPGCSINPILCAVQQVGGGSFTALFNAAASWVGASTGWVWRELGHFLAATSDPSVVASAANPEFNTLVRVAPLLACTALCAAVITGLRHGDPASLVRDAAMAAPIVVIFLLGARSLASGVLGVVDDLCAAASPHASSTIGALAQQASNIPTSVPGFAVLLLDLAGVLGAVLLWFELVMRNAVLALLLAISPVVVATAVWPSARRLAVRLAETFVAVALAKFVVVVALSLGATATQADAPAVVVTGIAVLMLAVLAPFTLLRVVPLVEHSALHAIDGLRQRASAGARRGASAGAGALGLIAPISAPGAPESRADLGLDDWPGGPPLEFPDRDVEPPAPPIGEPRLRTGRRAYLRDRFGPVIGWHFDE